MDNKQRTEISALGEFGLIQRLTEGLVMSNASTLRGPGDDAAVISPDGKLTLVSTDIMTEGVDFDLTYFPLKHLGYKAVVRGAEDILAMNGIPQQVLISLGISSKTSVQQLDALYEGIRIACADYNIDLAGGDTAPSVNGLIINITAVGLAESDKIVYRTGACNNDLICTTGDLGAAYMGLHLLEREKRALEGHPDPVPRFDGYEYLLRRQLMPELELDMILRMGEEDLTPTAMIDITDGLASDLLQLCRSSRCGARIYLDRIPIARETTELAAELKIDPVTAALNGGDDHRLLFTIPLAMQEKISRVGGIEVIGHITGQSTGVMLVTPDGQDIPVTAPGFRD